MPLPVIKFSSSLAGRSDTLCSGAGPTQADGSTLLNGSDAFLGCAVSGYATRLGLRDFTGDLSPIAVDGSAVLYVAESAAGARNFSSIFAVSNTRHVGTCDCTSGSGTVGGVNEANYAVNDVVAINGAGASGGWLYTTVTATGSGTITVSPVPGTSGTGLTIIRPKQITVPAAENLGPNQGLLRSWAVGGVRASLAGSARLPENNSAAGDLMPGWALEFEGGYAETLGASVTFRRAGTPGGGRIIIRGQPGCTTLPLLTFTNNGIAFQILVGYMTFADFELRNTSASKTAALGINCASGQMVVQRVRISHATHYFGRGITVGSASCVENCDIGHCSGHASGPYGIVVNANSEAVRILGNCIHHVAGHAIYTSATSGSRAYAAFVGNLIHACQHGIQHAHTGTLTTGGTIIMGNTIHGCTVGAGIRIDSTSAQQAGFANILIANNNLTSNATYGIEFTSATPPSLTALRAFLFEVWNNNFHGNALGPINPAYTDLLRDCVSVDPQYVDPSNGDFRVGANLKELGWPLTNIGMGATRSYVDIGAAQRQEAGGGGSGGVSRARVVNACDC